MCVCVCVCVHVCVGVCVCVCVCVCDTSVHHQTPSPLCSPPPKKSLIFLTTASACTLSLPPSSVSFPPSPKPRLCTDTESYLDFTPGGHWCDLYHNLTLHRLSIITHHVTSYIYQSICVTIYSCVSVLLVITADEDPWTKMFCNNCCQSVMISSINSPSY